MIYNRRIQNECRDSLGKLFKQKVDDAHVVLSLPPGENPSNHSYLTYLSWYGSYQSVTAGVCGGYRRTPGAVITFTTPPPQGVWLPSPSLHC